MIEYKIGAQFVKTINGQDHMLKVVEARLCGDYLCIGCDMAGNTEEQWCKMGNGIIHKCNFGGNFIVKDMGILKDGFLPCPFTGKYPEVTIKEMYGEPTKKDKRIGCNFTMTKIYTIKHYHVNGKRFERKSLQRLKDKWNTRS